MATKLTKLALNRIDLVDRGANPGAHVALFKRAPITKDAPTKTVSGQTLHASDFAYVGDASDPETWKLPIHDEGHARNALARFTQTEGIPAGEKAAVHAKIVAAAKEHGIDVSEDTTKMADTYKCPDCGKQFTSKAEMDAHMAEEKQEGETAKRLAKMASDLAAMTTRAEAAEAKLPKPEEDEIVKAAIDPVIKAAIKKAQDEAEKARKEAAAAREEVAKATEEREQSEFIGKAEKLPSFGRAREFGPILHKISKALTADEWKVFWTRLNSADHALRVSKAFDELGLSASEEGEPNERLTAMAQDLFKQSIAKGADKKMSFEQAYTQVLATPEGRELYAATLKGSK